MKKTIKFSILAFLLLIPCTLLLSSCGGLFGSHSHDFGEWTVVSAATCTAEGQETRTCSCGETQTQSIAMLSHVEVALPTTEPTCTETATKGGTGCSVCQGIIVEPEIIPALGHSFDLETHVCSTCQATLTQIASRNDFSEYTGTRDAVILLDKCIDPSARTEEKELVIAPGTDHVRLIGTAGVTYNLRISVDEAREKAMTIDLIDVTLSSSKKAPVIQYNGTQDLSIFFFGTECGLNGRRGDNGANASLISFSYNGDNAESGQIAIQAGGALRLVVAAEQVEIEGGRGGNGGDGQNAAPAPQSGGNGGNGGNGAQGIEASSIDVYITEGYTKESILIAGGYGGDGGTGGKKFMLGKDGSNGKSGTSATPSNVTPTYH